MMFVLKILSTIAAIAVIIAVLFVFFVSRSTFGTSYKSYSGEPANQYLLKNVLNNAKYLKYDIRSSINDSKIFVYQDFRKFVVYSKITVPNAVYDKINSLASVEESDFCKAHEQYFRPDTTLSALKGNWWTPFAAKSDIKFIDPAEIVGPGSTNCAIGTGKAANTLYYVYYSYND